MEFKGDCWDRGVMVSISRGLHAVFKFTANKPTSLFQMSVVMQDTGSHVEDVLTSHKMGIE